MSNTSAGTEKGGTHFRLFALPRSFVTAASSSAASVTKLSWRPRFADLGAGVIFEVEVAALGAVGGGVLGIGVGGPISKGMSG
eukprot:6502636-Pyramimonas_sp.AAC.1